MTTRAELISESIRLAMSHASPLDEHLDLVSLVIMWQRALGSTCGPSLGTETKDVTERPSGRGD